jgi:hypothetical protein
MAPLCNIGTAVGFASGVLTSVIAAYVMEFRSRSKAHSAVKKLAGIWVAHNRDGRNVEETPMPNALFTEFTPAKSRWAADSYVLRVFGKETDSDGKIRDHEGFLTIDPVCLGVRPASFAIAIRTKRRSSESTFTVMGRRYLLILFLQERDTTNTPFGAP